MNRTNKPQKKLLSKRVKTALCVLIFFLIPTLPLFADISYSANTTTLSKTQGVQVITLTGNVTLLFAGFKAETELVLLEGENSDIIRFPSSTTFTSLTSGLKIYGEASRFFQENQVLEINSWARIINTDEEISIQSNYAYIEIASTTMKMIGEVSIYQGEKDIFVTADTGSFANSTLTLRGNTSIFIGDDRFYGDSLVMNMKTDQFTLSDNVRGSLTNEGDM